MHIILGLVLALAILWAWLVGHWFARVLAFLLFAALFACIGAAITAGPPQANHAIFGGLLGIALAWPISGLPLYYWRAKIKRIEFAEQESIRLGQAGYSSRLPAAATAPRPAPHQPEPPPRTPYRPEPDGLGLGWRAQIGAALLGQAIAAVIVAIAVAGGAATMPDFSVANVVGFLTLSSIVWIIFALWPRRRRRA